MGVLKAGNGETPSPGSRLKEAASFSGENTYLILKKLNCHVGNYNNYTS